MAKIITTWFIEPINEIANYALSKLVSEENCCEGVLCADGQRRDLWKCDHYTVKRIEFSKEFRFRVFVKQGKFGQVRLWRFGKKKKGKAIKTTMSA